MNNPPNISMFLKIVPAIFNALTSSCLLQDSYPINLVKQNLSKNLALIDPFAGGCSIAIARSLNAKIVFVSALVESSLLHVVIPTLNMNFFQRSLNIFAHYGIRIFLYQLSLAKIFGYTAPGKDVYSFPESSMAMVNMHKFLEAPIPRTNAYFDIGNSIPKITINNIDKETKSFIENYEKVVLLSFSTFTSDGVVTKELYSKYVEMFQQFPKIGFIWRQKEILEELSKNVLLVSWINQRAIIAHPKVKILITHCGLNSIIEAINVGIPMIGIPSQGDQYSNAERIQRAEIGIIFKQSTFSSKDLSNAHEKIFKEGNKHEKNAKRMKEMLEFERKSGLSTDISWTLNKFLKTDTEHFQQFYIPKGNRDSWKNFLYFDWIFIFIVLLILIKS
uniref:glucuronosyltransferase n=1 Tax=Panagrolaimus davidi TaxID=227884 RepID=A0A914QJ71_9BILA